MTRAATDSPPASSSFRVALPAGKVPVSILVLTKDEEVNLEACLRCFDFTDDVVLFDSYSTDRTLEIAAQFPNVRIIQRKFDNWSAHSNWALRNIPFKYPWVYYSDADERMPVELRDELIATTNDSSLPHVAYRLRYKNMFLGRWIRRGGIYPVWILRLFRPEKVRYEDREVNAHPVVDGSLGELRTHFIHYSFNKGLVPWFQKHNSYSQLEAREATRVVAGGLRAQIKLAFDQEKSVRRRAIKNLSFFPPFRALVRFLYMYFVRLAILDGAAGFHYAAMISMYEYWIELKLKEQRRHWRERTDALAARMLEQDRA
ncbi:MAG: glycosyltransferase family 2 protein [Phycisphaerae bacterium]|nr:glycosyltransferase family 2 protein [Phycisphaerae bacterium]